MNYHYPPFQMKQGEAAKYCSVSVKTFKRDYEPHLKMKKEGNSIFYLRTDLERLMRSTFNQKDDPAPVNHAVKHAKPATVTDDFESAVSEFANP